MLQWHELRDNICKRDLFVGMTSHGIFYVVHIDMLTRDAIDTLTKHRKRITKTISFK